MLVLVLTIELIFFYIFQITNLEYPVSIILEHGQEVDILIPDDTNSSLIQTARIL